MLDVSLVHRLISTQFPEWKDLPIKPVALSGWDNRTFHLGKHLLVRMPNAAEYAAQVEKEHRWLPKLAPLLPLSIPEPLAMGDPAYFKGESRSVFRSTLSLDADTWARGRAWALWKALIIAAEGKKCGSIIDEVLADHRSEL